MLIRRGADLEGLPESVDSESRGVLSAIEATVRGGTSRSLGFVVDANDHLDATWRTVCSRLGTAGVDALGRVSRDGFVGEATEFGAQVRVWLMPDNRQAGALEGFLRDLIEVGDQLLPHAATSTAAAKELGARFPAVAIKKAVLHPWLAWGRDPGRRYGVAIKGHYLGGDGDAVHRFLVWFSRVFGPPKSW